MALFFLIYFFLLTFYTRPTKISCLLVSRYRMYPKIAEHAFMRSSSRMLGDKMGSLHTIHYNMFYLSFQLYFTIAIIRDCNRYYNQIPWLAAMLYWLLAQMLHYKARTILRKQSLMWYDEERDRTSTSYKTIFPLTHSLSAPSRSLTLSSVSLRSHSFRCILNSVTTLTVKTNLQCLEV